MDRSAPSRFQDRDLSTSKQLASEILIAKMMMGFEPQNSAQVTELWPAINCQVWRNGAKHWR